VKPTSRVNGRVKWPRSRNPNQAATCASEKSSSPCWNVLAFSTWRATTDRCGGNPEGAANLRQGGVAEVDDDEVAHRNGRVAALLDGIQGDRALRHVRSGSQAATQARPGLAERIDSWATVWNRA
jgi:hypothetical protein